jgi:2-iminobutanoate/2-iminopropanoate deaminase
MQEQTRQVLRNVQTILKAAGTSLDRVVKVTVLLARPDLYREMNEAYAEFFPVAKPARVMVRFGADIPGVLVAIDAMALAWLACYGASMISAIGLRIDFRCWPVATNLGA